VEVVYYCKVSPKWVIKLTVIFIMGYHCYQLHTKLYKISFSQGKVHKWIKWKYNGTVHKVFDFKRAYDSMMEVLYNLLIEFEVLMKLARLIKMCLNKTYSKVRMGKHLSDTFPIQNGLKGDALSPTLFNFTFKYAIG
jgi:hypothetical protein